MKAIETIYKGYRFRSRLEARWAIFFDMLNLKWDYEKEGYDMDGVRYLPDFFIDTGNGEGYFIEIKGKQPTEAEIKKCRALSVHYPTFLFVGQIQPPTIEPFAGSWGISFPKIKQVGKDLEAFKGPLQAGIAEWHAGSLTFSDPRPYCWHQRDDGSLLLWPVPANELVHVNPATGVIETIDPLKAGTKSIDSEALLRAYKAARSARFEFGEKGI